VAICEQCPQRVAVSLLPGKPGTLQSRGDHCCRGLVSADCGCGLRRHQPPHHSGRQSVRRRSQQGRSSRLTRSERRPGEARVAFRRSGISATSLIAAEFTFGCGSTRPQPSPRSVSVASPTQGAAMWSSRPIPLRKVDYEERLKRGCRQRSRTSSTTAAVSAQAPVTASHWRGARHRRSRRSLRPRGVSGNISATWDNAFPKSREPALWRRAQRALKVPGGYDHRAWFFGTSDLPRWAGYTLGYRITAIYLRAGHEPSRSTGTPAERVIAAYRAR